MNSGDRFASETVLEKSQKLITGFDLPVFCYGDSIDVAEDGAEFYRKAKDVKKNKIGMITQHQAMFFNRLKISHLEYDLNFPLSGDYALISKVLKNTGRQDILKLEFPVCKFNMGGINESKRFKAIKEDFRIRKNIMGISIFMNLTLYVLHYLHGKIKRARPGTRFIRHKNLN